MLKSFAVAVVLAATIVPASAQSSITRSGGANLLDSYIAYIGEDDLYNSDGARLGEPWQVIRQDRANYHRFGIRDRLDESDSFFADADNRAAMERMLANGTIASSARRAILGGGALIQVDIYRGNGRDWVEVTVLN
jgi:hypothetical protein